MDINKKKKIVAGLSITSNIVLSLLKITAGVLTGSLSIISEAIHSMSDLLASVLTYFSVVKSAQPADDDHPYGHGKYEDMAGFIEGLLIIFASLLIINESTKNIIFSTHPELDGWVGISVMGLAVVMNIFVSAMLFKVAKESNSITLYADGEHLRTDIYSSLGVFLGLVIIKYTGHYALDSIIAIFIAIVIFRAGYNIVKRTLSNLLDHSLPKEDIEKIKQVIETHAELAVLKEHGIKARQVGPAKDIDIIILFPKDTTIFECHKICDEIEHQIQILYPNCSISIHSEPQSQDK